MFVALQARKHVQSAAGSVSSSRLDVKDCEVFVVVFTDAGRKNSCEAS